MSDDLAPQPPPGGQFLVYRTEDGKLKIDVRFEGETVWLTQAHMAELFQTSQQNISQHLQNIYDEGELQRGPTHKEFLSVRREGERSVQRRVDFYNLDAIISVGYRVKSLVATQFRIWATQRLREYIVKGFVLDDERLKNPDLPFDYFEELLRRIQDIRTAERRFYQKITDIYATSIDYDPTQEVSIRFFKTVQNKVHWAITGQTAAEIVHSRVDATKPNMGLTNWRGATIRKQDVGIAKNYLGEEELAALNNLVEQYLVFAEGQAMRRVPMHMADWVKKLDGFLSLNEREILTHAGSISHEIAVEKAELEYDKFKTAQAALPRPVDAEFEQAAKQVLKLSKPNLGLTNWRGAAIRKQDVGIAKNYLGEEELAALNNLVEQYLVFAEGQAMRRVPMHMADWVKKLDGFLTLNEREILTHAGSISHEVAVEKAELEYEKFKTAQMALPRPVDADFERATKQVLKLPKPKKPKPPKG